MYGVSASMTGRMGMSVRVTVLYIADCPGWQTALDRIHEAAHVADVEVRVGTQLIESLDDAQRVGFTGSPTIYLDGVDPFAQPGAIPALACRLYRTATGLDNAPTVDQLSEALIRQDAL